MKLLLVVVTLALCMPSRPLVALGLDRIGTALALADDPFNFVVKWKHSVWSHHVLEELIVEWKTRVQHGTLEWVKNAHEEVEKFRSTQPAWFDVNSRVPTEDHWDEFRFTLDRAKYDEPFPPFKVATGLSKAVPTE
jgi:hypothetical protein